MAIVQKNMTYEHTPQQVQRSYSGNEGHPEAGTGISGSLTTTAASNIAGVSINDRWEIMEFSNAALDQAVWNHWLPYSYVPELGVEVEIEYTSNVTTGNFEIIAGITSMDSGSVYGLDEDTEYFRSQESAPGTANDVQTFSISNTKTFGDASATIIPNRNVAFILVRDGNNANDTATGTFDVSKITFKWYENQEGNLTI